MDIISFILSMPIYVIALMIVLLVLVVILLISFFREHGLQIGFHIPWFGDVKVNAKGEDGVKKENEKIELKNDGKKLECEICKINVSKLVKDITVICNEMYYMKHVESLNQQLVELNNRLYIEASFINNLHAQLVTERIRDTNVSDNDMKTKLFLKNTQVLGYVWGIRKQTVYDFFKASILQNHFKDKSQAELRAFASEKCNVLFARIEESINLFPDWDDPEILIDRELYVNKLKDRIAEKINHSAYLLYERCQQIQKEYDKKIQEKQVQIELLTDGFSKSIPIFHSP